MNAAQAILVDTYNKGEFSHHTTPTQAASANDPLFWLLMSLFSTNAGADPLSQAIGLVDEIMDELGDIRTALVVGRAKRDGPKIIGSAAVAGKAELEVYECQDCGYHVGVDASFLKALKSMRLVCPACGRVSIVEGGME